MRIKRGSGDRKEAGWWQGAVHVAAALSKGDVQGAARQAGGVSSRGNVRAHAACRDRLLGQPAVRGAGEHRWGKRTSGSVPALVRCTGRPTRAAAKKGDEIRLGPRQRCSGSLEPRAL